MTKPQRLPRWTPEGLRLEFAWVGNGVGLYTCNATNSNAPLGSVWVNLTGNSFGQAVCEIVDIYVVEKNRRTGIAKYMQKYLLDTYGILRTGMGTRTGAAFMKATGWKRNRQTGDWYLIGQIKRLTK